MKLPLIAIIDALDALEPKVSTGPWMADATVNVGENWLVAHCGYGRDGKDHLVTTDHVHASEMDGDAKTDAEFIALVRNHWSAISAEYRNMKKRLEVSGD